MLKGYIIHGFLNMFLIRSEPKKAEKKANKMLDFNSGINYNSRLFEKHFLSKRE